MNGSANNHLFRKFTSGFVTVITFLCAILVIAPLGLVFIHLVRTAISIASIILGTTLLYSIGPNPPRRAATVVPGALLATWLWWLSTLAFAWYVRNIANYNVLYGSVGAVIALLVWMYLLSVIALYGCEFNAQRDQLIGVDSAVR